MTMTKEQYNTLEAELEKRGYKKYHNGHSNESYGWFKSPIPRKDDWTNSPYQIEFCVWDYLDLKKCRNIEGCPDYGVSVAILVSTDKIDRADLELLYENQAIDEIEKIAASFYEWCENILKK